MNVEFMTSKDVAYLALTQNLEKYIPVGDFNLNPSVFWIQKIMETYINQINKIATKTQAKLKFLQLLISNELWEIQQFPVKVNIEFIKLS